MLQAAEQRVFDRYDALIRNTMAEPPAQLDPRTATSYLEAIRQLIEADLATRAQAYSPVQWLHYLRDVPSFYWLGILPTTAPYDADLAEILTAQSRTQSGLLRARGDSAHPINASVAEQVADWVAAVRYLSQVHTNLRWAGKGAAFSAERPVLRVLPDPELNSAVALYDDRVARDRGFFLPRTGSLVASRADPSAAHSITGVFRVRSAAWQGSWEATLAAATARQSDARFGMEHFDLADLAVLNRSLAEAGIRWWSDAAALLTGFLCAISPAIDCLSRMMTVDYRGWLVAPRKQLEEGAARRFDDARRTVLDVFPGAAFPPDPAALFASVATLSPSAWPLRHGPAIRIEQGAYCVDLHAATQMLNEAAYFPTSGGREAELRGGDFERGVQALIDRSPWAPSAIIRTKVGASLKQSGRVLTNIDAIGERGATLLFVECKSVIHTDKADAGDFQAVRSMRSTIEEALAKWKEVLESLQGAPSTLAGLDLSPYRVLRVVCCPVPAYVPLGAATEFVAPDLRAAVSVTELQRWLHGK